ncbi:MAG: hypothetical protein ACE37H_12715 [Phycisphaeraceae bacterium]
MEITINSIVADMPGADLQTIATAIASEFGKPMYDSDVVGKDTIKLLDLSPAEEDRPIPKLDESNRVLYWASKEGQNYIRVIGLAQFEDRVELFIANIYPT